MAIPGGTTHFKRKPRKINDLRGFVFERVTELMMNPSIESTLDDSHLISLIKRTDRQGTGFNHEGHYCSSTP